MTLKIKQCEACGEPIVFLRTKSGRAMPVDADTVNDPEATEYEPRSGHESHFGSCSDGGRFRKKKDADVQT